MATLTGLQIDASYLGLLKTTDNAVIGATPKALTDGGGNATNIQVSNTATNFPSGTVDFTGATVSGLNIPIRAGSLTSDFFPNNIRNISTPGGLQVSSTAHGWESIALGTSCTSWDSYSTVLGWNAYGGKVGNNQTGGQVAIGYYARALGRGSIAIGGLGQPDPAYNNGNNCICIGPDTTTNTVDYGIAIGSAINVTGSDGTAIGRSTSATAVGAVALGTGVTAAKAATVSVTELETQLAGGGITMKSPNGTEFKLTVSDAGALVIT